MSKPIFLVIHSNVVETFQKHKCQCRGGVRGKAGIIKLREIHPLGPMNVWTELNDCPFK